jgi:choline dehydrogenase-like flavoprotein
MSATAGGGVVDRDLQVWGAPNLYVASAAVFPTSSHSNPTLTVLALAARLVDKLSK